MIDTKHISPTATSPFLVITPTGYTKHYYAGTERIAARVGKGNKIQHTKPLPSGLTGSPLGVGNEQEPETLILTTMKKVLLSLAVVAMIALCSCNKSKDCKCTTTQTLPGMDPVVTETTMTIEKGNCSDSNATQTTSIGGQEVTQVIECSQI